MKQKNLLITVFLLSFLSACSSVLESSQAPERIYLLKPYVLDTLNAPTANDKLALTISAAPGLDTNKLLILKPDAHLTHYASARWPDNSTEVFTALLKDSLESSKLFNQVILSNTNNYANLHLEIKKLYTLADLNNNAQYVNINLQGNLNCKQRNTIIKLNTEVDVNQNKLSYVVEAYQKGINEISNNLLNQIHNFCK